MKSIKKLSKLAVTGILTTAFALNFNACEQSPVAPAENGADASITTLAKKGKKGKKGKKESRSETFEAVSGSETLKFKKRAYKGGKIELDQGSKLTIAKNSLTPPPGTPDGAKVTITMNVELVNDELIFTFGPHGCQFDPPAELRIDYSDLGVKLPALYYVENGEYVEQAPDHLDTKNRFMLLHFDHFSRYAVAWSN